MDWNILLFLIFPYVAISLFVVVTIYRSVTRPFSISSLSSQLLENRKLYWGSIPFHYGISIIMIFHLVAVLFPQGFLLWNSVPLRLYLLELSGLILAIWSLVGLLILIYRRLGEARIKAVTTPMDIVILLALMVTVVTGIVIATVYRFGSTWFTVVFTPYIVSILTLQPRPELVAPLPWVIQLHVFNFYVLLILFPFSRLVHIITLPLGYLFRPWQIVIWYRSKKTV